MDEPHVEYEHRVTPLELFFDLVFVFAFTQVTTLLSNDPSWRGLGQGLLILTAVWWTWSGYAWLTNTVDPDEGAVRGAVLVAMGAIFIAALAVPHSFGDHGVLFGASFLIVAVMDITLLALAGRGDADLLAAVLRVAPATLGGSVLILVAGFADGPARWILWLAAVGVGYFAPWFAGVRGFRVHPGHFVERHGLIVIIAVGESLVAIGLGARATALGVGVICAALLGFVVATSLWLAYFDFFTIRAQHLLTERSGEERAAFARDVYTYLHLPMIVGIVLFAFAMKTTLAHVGRELDTISALCLCGGCALYLFAYMGVRWRVSRSVGGGRLVAAVVLAALFPLALVVPAIAALAAVAAVWVALHAYELIWWREARSETRALRLPASAS